jgi:hypothetical protein
MIPSSSCLPSQQLDQPALPVITTASCCYTTSRDTIQVTTRQLVNLTVEMRIDLNQCAGRNSFQGARFGDADYPCVEDLRVEVEVRLD